MLRKFPFVPGEFYHLYNRGNSKQQIFHDEVDYIRFLRLLFLSNSNKNFKIEHIRESKVDFYSFDRAEQLVSIGAYCLMPNHFHILISPLSEQGVSIFMKKLSTAYSMYYNKKYKRTGGLFEGRYKAEIANDDVYLKYLFSYIHLNPLKIINSEWKETVFQNKKEAQIFLETYPYSSLQDYFGTQRQEVKILERDPFPDYFNNKKEVRDNLYVWLSDRTDLSE